MAREMLNQFPVEIYCNLTGESVDLVLDGDSLDNVDDESSILVEIDGDPPPYSQIQIRIIDGAGGDYDVYAWEGTGATAVLWDLHTSGYRHRNYYDHSVTVPIALVGAGGTPPSSPPAPGSTSTVLTVTVRKKDELPIGGGGGGGAP
ncbi:MAG: hypothetical protein H6712_00945 [Myxococcales bacterium]|nr:hypothetical protein [Myxococcales bacterium]MCB9712392.1 hypothetical protein [Myxococcales bacterium]